MSPKIVERCKKGLGWFLSEPRREFPFGRSRHREWWRTTEDTRNNWLQGKESWSSCRKSCRRWRPKSRSSRKRTASLLTATSTWIYKPSKPSTTQRFKRRNQWPNPKFQSTILQPKVETQFYTITEALQTGLACFKQEWKWPKRSLSQDQESKSSSVKVSSILNLRKCPVWSFRERRK